MQNTSVKVAIKMSDDTCAIMSFMTRGASPTLPYGATWEDNARPGVWNREPTDANLFAEITKAFPAVNGLGEAQPQPVQYKLVKDGDIPADRTFRNAWIFDGAKVDHDMAKARQIHMDRIRRVRGAELAKLDVEAVRADEALFVAESMKNDELARAATDAKTVILNQKQALRDLPDTFDLTKATTPEELKAAWPADLPRL